MVVTTFLSNEATAVVLTPAVYAAAKKAGAEPMPLLFACALVANTASFVLPISNPANLVLYGGHMPPLGQWLGSFALPSLPSILATFAVLRLVERRRMAGDCACDVECEPLSTGGKAALGGIVLTVVLLVATSALDVELGLPTAHRPPPTAHRPRRRGYRARRVGARPAFTMGVCPVRAVRHAAVVAGLFVLVVAVARLLAWSATEGADVAGAVAGAVLAVASNLMNNLAAGLVAADAVRLAHALRPSVDSLLIGVDLGPNLSITGSLATIVWLQAIRREGEAVSVRQFLKVGLIAMPIALVAALGTRLLI